MSERRYRVNEVFYSLQGEGVRAGEASVFVRFAKCNLECRVEDGPRSPGGFDCDTEFESGRPVTLEELLEWVVDEVAGGVRLAGRAGKAGHLADFLGSGGWVVLTGGEPALQVDLEFCDFFHRRGFKLAVETNGSLELPGHEDWKGWADRWEHAERDHGPLEGLRVLLDCSPFDWITVSPKVAEHAIRQLWAHEVKYVRGHGQAVPETRVRSLYRLLSPAFAGMEPDPRAAAWCVELAKRHPDWRLSAQMHKLWTAGGVR